MKRSRFSSTNRCGSDNSSVRRERNRERERKRERERERERESEREWKRERERETDSRPRLFPTFRHDSKKQSSIASKRYICICIYELYICIDPEQRRQEFARRIPRRIPPNFHARLYFLSRYRLKKKDSLFSRVYTEKKKDGRNLAKCFERREG